MHSKYSYAFDVAALYEALGGWKAVHRMLDMGGCDVTPKTVQKWKERKYISSDALAVLLIVATVEKTEINLMDFIIRRDDG